MLPTLSVDIQHKIDSLLVNNTLINYITLNIIYYYNVVLTYVSCDKRLFTKSWNIVGSDGEKCPEYI